MATKRQRRKRRRRAAGDATRRAPEPSAVATEDAPRATAARRRAAPGGPPPAPWGSFPLSELVVLVALVMLVAGFFVEPPRGAVMIGTGLVLGSLAGLELAVREHFAGYRSHTAMLAACAAFVAGAVMVLAVTGPTARVPVALVALGVFGAAFYGLREVFKRRSGGLSFR